MHVRACIEEVGDAELNLGTAQPGMLHDDFGDVAGICEKPQIEGAIGREAEIVAVQRIHRCPAAPVRNQPRAETIVEVTELRLNIVTRRAARSARRLAVQIIEHRTARDDHHLIDEGNGVGEVECDAPPAVVAAGATEEPAATAATEAAAASLATTVRFAAACRRCGSTALRSSRTRLAAWRPRGTAGAPTAEPKLSTHLILDGLGGPMRL